ncbi:hypothetical protein B4140_1721 [Bacillus amyloliquefaciens]|nr:hypothetical protein B4140_1721 [Bacillus amyloliquefaciens]
MFFSDVFSQRGETISLSLSKTKTGKMAWNGIVPFSLKEKQNAFF